jgi:nitrate/TMAO reductase-like tetraheme cytochrome c subunit
MIPPHDAKSSLITTRVSIALYDTTLLPTGGRVIAIRMQFMALLLAAAPLRAQGPRVPDGRAAIRARDVVQCDKCHADRGFLSGKAKTAHGDSTLFVPDSVVGDSRHAKLSCAECHAGYNGGYPHKSGGAKAVACSKCHDKQGEGLKASIHAPSATTKDDAPTCVSCHGNHDVRGAKDPASPTYAFNVKALCGSCHNDKKFIATYYKSDKHKDARTAVTDYEHTIHGVAMTKDGLNVSATCNDCHDAHRVLPADSAASTINRANVAKTCGTCHAGVLSTFDSSSHGKALASRKQTDTGHDAPVCVDCHAGHKLVAANDTLWTVAVTKQCGSCHEELVKSYFETYHGQVTALGFGVTAKCSDCHTAHAMLPAKDPRSSVNKANLVATCGKCHPGANAKFVQYMPHGEPQNRAKNPGLYWVWLFMTGLLVGVFAFFGSHTLLWLFRLVIERIRGVHHTPVPPVPPLPAPEAK